MKERTAGDIMNTSISSVVADWPIPRLAEYLVEKNISGAPVVDNGELVGVVSLTDIAWGATLGEEEPSETPLYPHWFYSRNPGLPIGEDQHPLEMRGEYPEKVGTVEEIMNPTIFSIDEETPVKDVAGLMLNNHIHRVFVTRNDELVGIITSLDLVRLLVDED